MKDKKTINIKNIDVLFLSYFGTGFFPFAPGTFGTLATIPLIYLLHYYSFTLIELSIGLSILTIISCYIAEYSQKKYHVHDPSWIVIDEVIGMILTWMFYCGSDPYHLTVLFILFRFFDIVKIWPASYFDTKVKHGAGTIIDDVISGVFAGVCYLVFINFFPQF